MRLWLSIRLPVRKEPRQVQTPRNAIDRMKSVHAARCDSECAPLLPLLHHDTTTLELGHVTKLHALVVQILAWESGHQRIRSLATGSAGSIDKFINVADSVSGIEA